jgi:sterol desaturase/sphingolipid hydroxylase (fatty acid hydroxylase superfamily)
VDLARPVLAQVDLLGERYLEWVYAPLPFGRTREVNLPLAAAGDTIARRWPDSLRLFRTGVLERWSHTPWWVPALFWPAVSAVAVAASVRGGAFTLGLFVAGMALWMALEYLLHRFLFHFRPFGRWSRRLHFLMHGIHHLDPFDRTRRVFTPLLGVPVASVVFGGLLLALPFAEAVGMFAGTMTAFVVYDVFHHFLHEDGKRGRLVRYLRRRHYLHHFGDWRVNFGVTSPIVDAIAGTARRAR